MKKRQYQLGISLPEIMVVAAVTSLISAMALPTFGHYVDRAHVAKASGDIGQISVAIERFRLNNNDQIPVSLSEVDMDIPLDPWDRAYVFVSSRSALTRHDVRRMDNDHVPLNTDFDLYSRGKDGTSGPLVSSQVSADDILRADNGSYIGLGKEY